MPGQQARSEPAVSIVGKCFFCCVGGYERLKGVCREVGVIDAWYGRCLFVPNEREYRRNILYRIWKRVATDRGQREEAKQNRYVFDGHGQLLCTLGVPLSA